MNADDQRFVVRYVAWVVTVLGVLAIVRSLVHCFGVVCW